MAVVLAFPEPRTARRSAAELIARSGLSNVRIAEILNRHFSPPVITAQIVAVWRAGHSNPADELLDMLEELPPAGLRSSHHPRVIGRFVLRELVRASGLGIAEFAERMREEAVEVTPELLQAWLEAGGPSPLVEHLVAALRVAGPAGQNALLGLGEL